MKLLSTLAALPVLFAAAPALAAPQHNLVVTLTAPANPQVNTTGHYVARVTNTGNRNATGVTLTIALPATHTSPQVYVLGNLTNVDTRCTRTGTTLTCALNGIARFGGFTEVAFDYKPPYSTAPLNFTYTANPIAGDANPSNNTLATTVAAATIATPITTDLHLQHDHCTGTGLTSWFECALFPSSISGFAADYTLATHSISIVGEPTAGGSWSPPSPDRLVVTFTDNGTPVGTLDARGVGNGCFEGPMTFIPQSSYMAIYRVCP